MVGGGCSEGVQRRGLGGGGGGTPGVRVGGPQREGLGRGVHPPSEQDVSL